MVCRTCLTSSFFSLLPAALLFALPSVRTVQPAVPAIGAAVDVIGFFW